MPLIAATSSADLNVDNPSIVALTILIGVDDPKDLEMIFVIPANSTTALTGPPAMIPVPAGAGFKNTLPAP